jgi:hypothetical protein
MKWLQRVAVTILITLLSVLGISASAVASGDVPASVAPSSASAYTYDVPQGLSLKHASAIDETNAAQLHLRLAPENPVASDFGVAAKTGPGTAVRPVGAVLESVDDVIVNPSLLAGKHPAQVENVLRGSPGWETGTLGRGRSAGSGWTFREMNSRGTDYTGRYIQWSPGSLRHFGGEPYWKVSSGDLGTVRLPQ